MEPAPVAIKLIEPEENDEWQPRKTAQAFQEQMRALQKATMARARGEQAGEQERQADFDDTRPPEEEAEQRSKVVSLKDWRVRYYHNDHLGTPRELSDEDGGIVWQATYKAWGNTLKVEAARPATLQNQELLAQTARRAEAKNDLNAELQPIEQNLRFQGQYFDEETGLHYNRFRYYDPDVGRFVSQDPIKLAGGDNLYGYAPNPMVWLDPFGLKGFFAPCKFKAPSGKEHTVYQHDINWDLPVNTRNGVKTNLEIASEGGSPFVVKNGKYSQLNLHHSKQNANGSLFELSADTHQAYYGSNALHPHLPNAHPINPVDRDSFNVDRGEYWRQRAAQEKSRRLGKKCSCTC